MPSARKFFTAEQQQQIVHAISHAESHTSGEIRVHLEDRCQADPVQRATAVFEKLGMHQTALRNGILIYLAVKDHQFAIIGDAGIHEKVSDTFWTDVRDRMLEHFREHRFADGLCAAVQEAGRQLKTYFPRADDDIDEMTNEISFPDA